MRHCRIENRPARPEDAEAIARVHVDTWRTAYAGIVPADYLRRLSYAQVASRWRERIGQDREGFLLVAEEEQAGVVGFVSGGRLREAIAGRPAYQGEVYALYVRAERQRRGIGSRLMEQAFRWLRERGWEAIVVWVLEENVGLRFYEALGGRPIARKTITIGGLDLAEVAYGWRQNAPGV